MDELVPRNLKAIFYAILSCSIAYAAGFNFAIFKYIGSYLFASASIADLIQPIFSIHIYLIFIFGFTGHILNFFLKEKPPIWLSSAV